MAKITTKIIKYVGQDVNFNSDVILQDDGQGAYIKEWNLDIAKPTDEQLLAQDAAATTEENNQVVIRNRKSEYGTTEYQIENIIENGLSAEQTRVQAIKDKYPKE